MTKPPLRSTGACSTTVGSKPSFLSQNASVGPAIPAPEIRTDLELITEDLVDSKLNARRLDYDLPQRNWRSHDACRSTSIQPLYFRCDSGWLDVLNRSWNRQLAAVIFSQFVIHWLLSWLVSWLTMLPVVVLAAPMIQSASFRLTSSE